MDMKQQRSHAALEHICCCGDATYLGEAKVADLQDFAAFTPACRQIMHQQVLQLKVPVTYALSVAVSQGIDQLSEIDARVDLRLRSLL